MKLSDYITPPRPVEFNRPARVNHNFNPPLKERAKMKCKSCGHPNGSHKFKFDGETYHCEECTAEGKTCLKMAQDESADRRFHGDPMSRMREVEGER